MNEELPQTERVNPETTGLDVLATRDLVKVLVDDHRTAVDAVRAQSDALADIADDVAAALRSGGRLHYVGAGTSGRLATLDAAEIPPTFGIADVVCAHIAGGPAALTHAVEGAEDDDTAGAQAMRGHVYAGDVVIGLSASGRAAFVAGALAHARALGALTVAFVNTDDSPLATVATRTLVFRTGPEALAGSTRLKAGTAQKIALNTLSTAVMVRLGKVYDNLMVDVVATNRKLHARALRLLRMLTGVDEARALAALEAAGGRVKIAVVMIRHDLDAERAVRRLNEHGGSLRASL